LAIEYKLINLWWIMDPRIKLLAASSAAASIMMPSVFEKDIKARVASMFAPRVAQALVYPEDYKRLHSINTNIYVWGEGFQVDPTQDYSNFTPKKIQQFKSKDKPNPVDIAFGWYHEAYIDSKGNLYVAAKAKVPSIEVEGVPNGDRPDLHLVDTLPRGAKVKQSSFTQNRFFVLTQSGQVFVYKIREHFPKREDLNLMGLKAQPKITGELMVDEQAIQVKDLPPIKQLATGLDHVTFLTTNGEVYAMGDDTFGQCGGGGEGRSMTAPFFEARHRRPVRVEIPIDQKTKKQPKIKKVVSGFRHNLAISECGKVYGWGYNNQ